MRYETFTALRHIEDGKTRIGIPKAQGGLPEKMAYYYEPEARVLTILPQHTPRPYKNIAVGTYKIEEAQDEYSIMLPAIFIPLNTAKMLVHYIRTEGTLILRIDEAIR